MSKLNNIYEQLDKQAVNDDVVQIRHFSIIDEAHYMLSFDNRPLRNLIAVGRNKGLSIMLATQEIRTAIAGLQKGELIIKDQIAFALGMVRKYTENQRNTFNLNVSSQGVFN